MMNNNDEQSIFNENYYNQQFHLLEYMYARALENKQEPQESPYHTKELAENTKFETADEVLRYLYILEGQKLVTPHPDGDFTSNEWKLTAYGEDVACKLYHKAIDPKELW